MADGGRAGDDGDDAAFVERVVRALDGLLDEAGVAALNAELTADVERRRLFVSVCLQSGALAEARGLLEPRAAGDGAAFLDALSARLAAGRGAARARRRARVLAAASLLAAAAAGALLPRALGSRGAAPGRAPAQAQARARVDAEDGLAIVVGLDGVAWGPGEAGPPVGELLGAGRLRFRSGRMTLALLNGATIVVEGPADLDLVSHDRVFCREGKLRARVPKGAEGLVIASPGSAVLDLGTEFGLNVEGGASSVRVFEGRVETMMRSGSGNQNISHILGPDRALRIDPGAAEVRPMEDTSGFAGPPDLARPSLGLDGAYTGAVLASRPWGYWRFGAMGEGAVANEVAGRPPLRAVGAVRVADGAAAFPAGEDLQYFALDGTWAPPAGDGYAAELWFLPERIDHASLISMMAPRDSNNHAFFLETTSRNRHTLHPPASIRFLDRWPPAMSGGYNLYSTRPYVPYRWHHLVGQMNRGRMELYLDGEMTCSVPKDLVHPTLPCQVLIGRLTSRPYDKRDDAWIYDRSFVGRIDEVALYDRPLTPEEIRAHRALAAPGAGPRADQTRGD